MALAFRKALPRLHRLADDPDFRFPRPRDAVRRAILSNILRDCRAYENERPPRRLTERLDSPHPFHQLYITFYEGMRAQALIEHFSYAWRLTGDARWLAAARRWLAAACSWEHSDRVEEHFYTANRYMQAFAVALDVMDEALTESERERVTQCLLKLMARWWPEVRASVDSQEAGHHAVIDTAHFGIAALGLLGRAPEAEEWVETVLRRFRNALLPGAARNSGAPWDGPSFWSAENMWRFQFADALRNVTGIDLFREFRREMAAPLEWLRYHVAPWGCGGETLEQLSPPLLMAAQLAGDGEMRRLALSDPRLGRIRHYHAGVKGSAAECILSWGPYACLFYDPAFRPIRPGRRALTAASRAFATQRGESDDVVLRSSAATPELIARVTGVHTPGGADATHLHVQWKGRPVLKLFGSRETQPFQFGSRPRVGGLDESVGKLGRVVRRAGWDMVSMSSPRTEQEYWLLRSEPPVLVAAGRLKPRGVRLLDGDDRRFVRLDGSDYLQYERAPHFNPDEGQVRMVVRLTASGAGRALFHVATGGGLNAGSSMLLAFADDGGLTFEVQSQMWHPVRVRPAGEKAPLADGTWHELVMRWGGLNVAQGAPFIELAVDGRAARQDDPAEFREVKSNAQGLAPRASGRTFRIRPNTCLAFGARVQTGSGAACDIAEIEVRCAGRRPLVERFEAGLTQERGSGPLAWAFTPVGVVRCRGAAAVLKAGARRMRLLGAWPAALGFEHRVVPVAQSGFAAGSLKRFGKDAARRSSMLVASAGDAPVLAVVFAGAGARPAVVEEGGGFRLRVGGRDWRFKVHTGGRILSPRQGGRKV